MLVSGDTRGCMLVRPVGGCARLPGLAGRFQGSCLFSLEEKNKKMQCENTNLVGFKSSGFYVFSSFICVELTLQLRTIKMSTLINFPCCYFAGVVY